MTMGAKPVVTLKCEEGLRTRLQREAARREVSASAVVRYLLREKLPELEEEKAPRPGLALVDPDFIKR